MLNVLMHVMVMVNAQLMICVFVIETGNQVIAVKEYANLD